MEELNDYHFYTCDRIQVGKALGKEVLQANLEKMLKIRHFEIRAESAYQQGKVGGFFHSYWGQEGSLCALHQIHGNQPWYVGTYRCHGLALLLGASVNEVMAELYGKQTGNALGRGGSMHLYAEKMLGGFGIVGGQIPIATGAAFSLKYQQKDSIAICFIGDGAVPQGAFHESLNMASLWSLPCLYIIENNFWGMGTHFRKANCVSPLAEKIAPSYNMKSLTINGSDFLTCYKAFEEVQKMMQQDQRPMLIEVVAGRFRGHSISDPGLYRSKEELKEMTVQSDPILILKTFMIEQKMLTEKDFEQLDKNYRDLAVKAMEFADQSPFPPETQLEEGVYSP